MYTWEGRLFPSPFTFVHTKVTTPLSLILLSILLFPNCIQNNVTSQLFSLSVGLKNPDLYYWLSFINFSSHVTLSASLLFIMICLMTSMGRHLQKWALFVKMPKSRLLNLLSRTFSSWGYLFYHNTKYFRQWGSKYCNSPVFKWWKHVLL